MIKKTSVEGAYAKKTPYEFEGRQYEADIKNGDTVKILNEGSTVTGQFGEQQVFQIETRNGAKNLTLNQSSINVLVDELGEESSDWVGKEVQVITKKDVIAGKKVEIAYLVTPGYVLDEWGDLSKQNGGESTPEAPVDEISPDDIPF